MPRLIVARLLSTALTFLFILSLSFVLMKAAPGGPFELERPLDAATVEFLRQGYGLDAPIWRQFLSYLSALAHGDLGSSFAWRDVPVRELFADALPVSAALGGTAMLIAFPLGAALGLAAAARAGSWLDHGISLLAALGLVAPSFVLAPALQLVFGLWLGWLPVGGSGSLAHYVLPVAILALPQCAAVSRLTRDASVEALTAPHSRTALAYGLPKWVRIRRAFRSALLPLVSYMAPAAASVMTGSVVVESLFGLPGVGRYFVEGALERDYTVSLAAVLLAASAVLGFNLLADLVYLLVDPRVRT